MPNVRTFTSLTLPLASRVRTYTRYVPPALTPENVERQLTVVAGAAVEVHAAAMAGSGEPATADSHDEFVEFHHLLVCRFWIISSTFATDALSVAVPWNVTGASGTTACCAGEETVGTDGCWISKVRAAAGLKTWILSFCESVT